MASTRARRPLLVVQLLPALESGGVERSTIEIADALQRAGHRAVVVSAGGRLVPVLEATGARHIRLAVGAKSPLVPWRLLQLRWLLWRLRPDIVHARSRLPAWLAWWALRGRAADAPPPALPPARVWVLELRSWRLPRRPSWRCRRKWRLQHRA